MQRTPWFMTAGALLLLVGIVSCAGGGGSTSPPPGDGGVPDASGFLDLARSDLPGPPADVGDGAGSPDAPDLAGDERDTPAPLDTPWPGDVSGDDGAEPPDVEPPPGDTGDVLAPEDAPAPDVVPPPVPEHLCRPCDEEGDCDEPGGAEAVCLEHAPAEGSFCAIACAVDDCPAGYECVATTWPVSLPLVCVPAGEAPCPCESWHLGYRTSCRAQNEWGSCYADRACDERCPASPPTQEECNGVDDDCDGVTDDLVRECSTVCGAGEETCVEGGYLPCTAPPPLSCFDYTTCATAELCVETCPPLPEEVCNGLDDDCDGVTDGVLRTCNSACGVGIETCTLGVWGGCTAPGSTTCLDYTSCESFEQCSAVCPSRPTESCNGVDDDCDGETDHLTRPCAGGCGPGSETCLDGTWVGCDAPEPITCTNYTTCVEHEMCAAACPPVPAEVCNNRDDDCNGEADDGLVRTCSTACGEGERICTAGVWSVCTAPLPNSCMNFATCRVEDLCVAACSPPPEEVCNGEDDDCSGAADDGDPALLCATPPAAWCDATFLHGYEPSGTCEANGECSYTPTLVDCLCGCRDGACLECR